MLPVSFEIEESWDLNSKTQTKFYRSRKTSWQITSFSSLFPGYDSISYLAELSGHILQDIGRCIIEKRLESWEVGAFLYDILYGPFTLLKYKAERIQSLAIHVSSHIPEFWKWNQFLAVVSFVKSFLKNFTAEPSPQPCISYVLSQICRVQFPKLPTAKELLWLALLSLLSVVFC